MDLSGTVVPMATPTCRNRRAVDTDALERFTRQLVEGGVHGLFPCSSIGEFPSLTSEQNRRVIETVAATADDTPVLAGCCDTSVDGVLDRIDAAETAGADAAVVVTPYYLGATQNGLDRFFEAVADESGLPLFLYNIPPLTGNELGVDLVASLADHDAVVGLKDTSGDLVYLQRVIESTPANFRVFQGATELATASLAVGADGLIGGPANVFPEPLAELYEAHVRGDDATVRRLTRSVVFPLVSGYWDLPTAAAIKHLVEYGRFDIGDPLPPLAPLSAGERERLESRYHTVSDAIDAGLAEQ